MKDKNQDAYDEIPFYKKDPSSLPSYLKARLSKEKQNKWDSSSFNSEQEKVEEKNYKKGHDEHLRKPLKSEEENGRFYESRSPHHLKDLPPYFKKQQEKEVRDVKQIIREKSERFKREDLRPKKGSGFVSQKGNRQQDRPPFLTRGEDKKNGS